MFIKIVNMQYIYITSTDFFVRFFGGGKGTKSDESEDQSSGFCINRFVHMHILVVKHDTSIVVLGVELVCASFFLLLDPILPAFL